MPKFFNFHLSSSIVCHSLCPLLSWRLSSGYLHLPTWNPPEGGAPHFLLGFSEYSALLCFDVLLHHSGPEEINGWSMFLCLTSDVWISQCFQCNCCFFFLQNNWGVLMKAGKTDSGRNKSEQKRKTWKEVIVEMCLCRATFATFFLLKHIDFCQHL